ncbi:TetR/AcrR family transcriptional regulator [Kitasatospora sp. A2-31]|uniref:TetR/AcrR family transcriptional regulator n=1 Tax=Kitasatospora sp. A2-31 TaxID=2916414 RepID=UPI001EEE5EB4|nr:TetR/AcrR family transcriptional regulator [Kitasatospora sp. A2-31]MCG6498880.1 TetR/AcrR family transcriptional regulator [Kitasatospora sp. A2-31]MCG6500082.1 TetR/AcrR family transcriptional regulator [Kitasatospora sp. A2-31]
MNAAQDPRAERTRATLRRALLEECAERPLAEVSVAALVRRAGVGRATFYVHYPDLEALAVDACADIVREAVDALHAWRGIPDPAAPPGALTGFFTELVPHAALHRALLTPGGGGPLGLVLRQELRERSRTERALAGAPAPDLVASAVAGTFTCVLADWLHGRIEADPELVAHQVWRLLISLHRTPQL